VDFFTHQDNARRLTKRLVVLFALAVVAVVAAVNLAAVYFFGWDVSAHVVVSVMTLAVIFGGTTWKLIQISSGGTAVAESVGGRRVAPGTTDLHEKRLLNVVEEMALASGIAVPTVYVLDEEEGINAFAAGLSTEDAVVAVTRGTLRKLNREELQGVVAHEFSHILNGDMRLNVRMIGVLHGILVISMIGYTIMRFTGDSRSSRSSRDKDNSGGIFLFGLALYVIGYVGKFCADLIKAAVSRQREFLADASAVQFTRNPEGIGGALVKIGLAGSRLQAAHAPELSHMFLGEGVKLSAFLATHPPIDERVGRVLGERAGAEYRRRAAEEIEKAAEGDGLLESGDERVMGFGRSAGTAAGPASSGFAAGAAPRTLGESGARVGADAAGMVLDTVGNPTSDHVRYAGEVLAAIPPALHARLVTPDGARGAMFALLFGSSGGVESRAASFQSAGAAAELALATPIAADIAALGMPARLPIVDLAVPALRTLPAPDRRELLAKLRKVALADQRLDAFEFVLLAVLTQQLSEIGNVGANVRFRSLDAVKPQVALVVSVFVRAASQGSVLFERTMATLGLAGESLTPPSRLDFDRVEGALIDLRGLPPLAKPRLIKACLEIVMADGKVAVYEAELMRAVCAMLDSPLPPMLERAAA
jgi:Zn-dependent protease with chaperone function